MASYGSYKAYLVKKICEVHPEELEEKSLYQLSNKTLEKILTDFKNGKFYKSCKDDYKWGYINFSKKRRYEIEENDSNSKEKYYKTIKQELDRLEKLEKENQELRNSIKSLDETAGNLLKENRKLKNIIEILKEAVDEIEIITCDEEDCYGEVSLYQKINGSISIPLKTKEEYILAKELLSNEC